MTTAQEARLVEVLVTHNEPVAYVDLACALGLTDAEVRDLGLRLETLGYAVVDDESKTVAPTPAAQAALR